MNHDLILRIIIWVVPIVFSIVLHEWAHGWMANRLGDPTAKNMGRLTLNPLPHIDMIGTVILPLVMLFLGGPVFGWAKPVPFNPHNFHRHIDIRKGTMWVALAGPGSNLLLAFIFSFILVLVNKFVPSSLVFVHVSLSELSKAVIYLNLFLAFLNLIPIPPLDGSKVVMRFLPTEHYNLYLRLERYGMIILIVLLVSGGLSYFVLGPVDFFYKVFLWLPRFLFNEL
ncbi:MAG: site-2 protease family protein [Deltaproteobacteria bacterium]|nr:site-2 protease family protein [Deltaproteobacteria bacterium]